LTQPSATVDAGAPAEMWVSISEAAKQQGVSRQAAHKRVEDLVANGRLSTRPGPRNTRLVNLAAYLRAVRDETDPAQYLRNRMDAPLFDRPLADPEVEDDETGDLPASDGANYQRARAQREAFNAENARLDLEERRGALVDKDEVDRRQMEIFRRLRDRLLQLPATSAGRLAAQSDERAVRTMLDKDIRAVLERFANELDRMAETDGFDVAAE
jgi:DNA-binding MarR family transcriptional regulator